MSDKKINCSIITPGKAVYEGTADMVSITISNGEAGFLINHAPLISELGIGEARIKIGAQTEYFVIENGFVEIMDNEMILLAENAFKKDELAKVELESQLRDLDEKRKSEKDPDIRQNLDLDVKKMKARLKVASR
jgi:F-type H+-transporting ATPase subunit epsilon